MSSVTFESNTVFLMDEQQFRFKKKFGLNWQIENVTSCEISNIPEENLFTLYKNNEITFPHLLIDRPKFKKNDSLVPEFFNTIPPDTRIRLLNIRSFLERHINLFNRSLSIKHLDESLNKYWVADFGPKPHVNTAQIWLKKYWNAGKDISALRPANHRKGNRTKRLQNKVEEICLQAINEFYLTTDRKGKKFVLDKACIEIDKQNTMLAEPYKLPKPSIHYINKLINSLSAYEVCVARYGKDYARNRYRHSIESGEKLHPLQKFEADHTLVDIILVDEFGYPIGKPWLTVIIDVFTRVIIGYEITFEHPSYKSLAKALLHAILPKTNQKNEYPDTVSDYSMFGIPESIFVDNASEFHGHSFDSMCFELGTIIVFTGRKTPWNKPHVESFNHTVNSGFTEYLPGRTFRNIAAKADNNPLKDAKLTIDSFKKIFNKWIVDIYHHSKHTTLGMTPAQCWEEFVDKESIKLPSELNRIQLLALETITRKLQHYGLEINKISYNNEALGIIRKHHGLDLKLEVRWDKDDLSCIHAISPEGEIIKVSASGRWKEYTTDLTLYQHEANTRYLKSRKKECTVDNLIDAKADLMILVQKHIVAKGKKVTSKKEHKYFDGNSRSNAALSSQIDKKPMTSQGIDQPIVASEFTAIVSPHVQNVNGVAYDR